MSSKLRTRNFSEEEKDLLAELGKQHPEIESKGYDNKSLTKKAKAWEEIFGKFNAESPRETKREMVQLQGCWKRLKYQIKKENIRSRKPLAFPCKTGELCANAIPSSITQLTNTIDDDARELFDEKNNHCKQVEGCDAEPSGLVSRTECECERNSTAVSRKPGMSQMQAADNQR